MRVNKLLNTNFKNNHLVSLITDNSKECINNAVFVMHKINYKYLDEAIRKGAKTIIFNDHLEVNEDVNLLIVKDTYKVIADALYLMHKKILKKYILTLILEYQQAQEVILKTTGMIHIDIGALNQRIVYLIHH